MARRKKVQDVDETKNAESVPDAVASQDSVSDTGGVGQIEDPLKRIRELNEECGAVDRELAELKAACSQAKAQSDAAGMRLRAYIDGLKLTMPLFEAPQVGQFEEQAVFPGWYNNERPDSLSRQTRLDKLMGAKLAIAVLEGCGAGTLGDLFDFMCDHCLDLAQITGSAAQAEAVKRAIVAYFESSVAAKATAQLGEADVSSG